MEPTTESKSPIVEITSVDTSNIFVNKLSEANSVDENVLGVKGNLSGLQPPTQPGEIDKARIQGVISAVNSL